MTNLFCDISATILIFSAVLLVFGYAGTIAIVSGLTLILNGYLLAMGESDFPTWCLRTTMAIGYYAIWDLIYTYRLTKDCTNLNMVVKK